MNTRQKIIALLGVLVLFVISLGLGYVVQTHVESPWNVILCLVGGAAIGAVGVPHIVRIANRE